MSQFPALKPKEIEKILLKNNFVFKHQAGSHLTFFNKESKATVVVPLHNKDLPRGTLGSIIRQSKLPRTVFANKNS